MRDEVWERFVRRATREVDAEVHYPPGGHVVHGHELTGRCKGCGMVGSMIAAYGYPTCPASDLIDAEAREVSETPELPPGRGEGATE